MTELRQLDFILWVLTGWLFIGACGLLVMKRTAFVARVLFPLGAVLGISLAAIGMSGVFAPPQAAILPLGLPGLPFHLRLDSLSSYFLFVLGVVSAGVSRF